MKDLREYDRTKKLYNGGNIKMGYKTLSIKNDKEDDTFDEFMITGGKWESCDFTTHRFNIVKLNYCSEDYEYFIGESAGTHFIFRNMRWKMTEDKQDDPELAGEVAKCNAILERTLRQEGIWLWRHYIRKKITY